MFWGFANHSVTTFVCQWRDTDSWGEACCNLVSVDSTFLPVNQLCSFSTEKSQMISFQVNDVYIGKIQLIVKING